MSLSLPVPWPCILTASLMIGLATSARMARATDTDRDAVHAIEEMGGRIEREKGDPGMAVVRVELSGTRATDAAFAYLKSLPTLKILDLTGTRVPDAGLR